MSLRTTVPFGLLAFWIAIVLAAWKYPSEYDWRYMTLSSLVYRDRNPVGYVWARIGLALCGLAGMYWTALRIRAPERVRAPPMTLGVRSMGLGFFCMTCCALLPERQLGLPRAHDLLALAGFVGICLGLVLGTFEAVVPGPADDPREKGLFRASIIAASAFSPIMLAAVTQAYVAHALPGLPWVGLAWRARGIPIYLSFAFWEWAACAGFSLLVLWLSSCTPASRREA